MKTRLFGFMVFEFEYERFDLALGNQSGRRADEMCVIKIFLIGESEHANVRFGRGWG